MSWNKRLPEIAACLGVTIDELAGTEKRPATENGDEPMTDEERDIIMRFRAASPELKAAVLRVVRDDK